MSERSAASDPRLVGSINEGRRAWRDESLLACVTCQVMRVLAMFITARRGLE